MEQVKRIHRDEGTWREIFARQAGSGLLVSEFCRQERINPGIFRRWRMRLENSAAQGVLGKKPPRGSGTAKPFVDLGALAGGSGWEIRLELGGGMVLSLVRG